MSSNSIGHIFRLTSFGESHGKLMGGVIDGCPAGIKIDIGLIQYELSRRKASHPIFESSRNESDEFEFVSGLFEGITTGTPLAYIINNKNHISSDYEAIKDIYRPSHADYTYQEKYGIRDYRGGGRASARESVIRIVAGSIAKQILSKYNINIIAFVSQIGIHSLKEIPLNVEKETIEQSPVRCPDIELSKLILHYLLEIKNNGDTVGGVVNCVIQNIPIGIGSPIYGKLQAELAYALFSINAVKGFEYGAGFNSANMKGSEMNDEFIITQKTKSKHISTKTNFSGGIQGGISNGEDIYFRLAFKPAPSIGLAQNTVDKYGNQSVLNIKGRHDICFVPRAVPVVEAMTAIVLLDQFMLNKTVKM